MKPASRSNGTTISPREHRQARMGPRFANMRPTWKQGPTRDIQGYSNNCIRGDWREMEHTQSVQAKPWGLRVHVRQRRAKMLPFSPGQIWVESTWFKAWEKKSFEIMGRARLGCMMLRRFHSNIFLANILHACVAEICSAHRRSQGPYLHNIAGSQGDTRGFKCVYDSNVTGKFVTKPMFYVAARAVGTESN